MVRRLRNVQANSLVQAKNPELDSTGYVPMRMVSPHFTLFRVKKILQLFRLLTLYSSQTPNSRQLISYDCSSQAESFSLFLNPLKLTQTSYRLQQNYTDKIKQLISSIQITTDMAEKSKNQVRNHGNSNLLKFRKTLYTILICKPNLCTLVNNEAP